MADGPARKPDRAGSSSSARSLRPFPGTARKGSEILGSRKRIERPSVLDHTREKRSSSLCVSRQRYRLEEIHDAPTIVPSKSLLDASCVVVPKPSSNNHDATVLASASRCSGGAKLTPPA